MKYASMCNIYWYHLQNKSSELETWGLLEKTTTNIRIPWKFTHIRIFGFKNWTFLNITNPDTQNLVRLPFLQTHVFKNYLFLTWVENGGEDRTRLVAGLRKRSWCGHRAVHCCCHSCCCCCCSSSWCPGQWVSLNACTHSVGATMYIKRTLH
jgi:hypothetical protein